jgi:hypothetical protein
LADNYKPRAIQIYDVRKAPFLNHYRWFCCSCRTPESLPRLTLHQTSCSSLYGDLGVSQFFLPHVGLCAVFG